MNENEMQCERCKESPATVHLTEFVNNEPVEHHLCERCFAEQEGSSGAGSAFSKLLATVAPALAEMSAHQCPACGLNYLMFRHSLRMGCQHDYRAFEEPLLPLLKEIHGDTRHCGKAPPGAGRREATRNRLASLKRRLDTAIAEENYEHAAVLRDRIGKLEDDGIDEPER